MTFLHRPNGIESDERLELFINDNRDALDRASVKNRSEWALFPIVLNGGPEVMAGAIRYYFGLFSHCRDDQFWKGMLEIGLQDEENDRRARASLEEQSRVAGGTGERH